MSHQMLPVYGFVEGDALGVLLLIYSDDTIEKVIQNLQQAVKIRVPAQIGMSLFYEGKILDTQITVNQADVEPLCRLDLRHQK
jgi:hypothetical protein